MIRAVAARMHPEARDLSGIDRLAGIMGNTGRNRSVRSLNVRIRPLFWPRRQLSRPNLSVLLRRAGRMGFARLTTFLVPNEKR
jgi:hypothetical protein